jgi:hypothetical protein
MEQNDTYDEYLEWALRDYVSSMVFSQARTLVRGHLRRALYCWASGADEKAAAFEKQAQEIADNWNAEHQDNSLRALVRVPQLYQSVLVNFVTGAAGRLPEQLMENLKRQVGADRVERILANVEENRQGILKTEELEEDLRRDPSIKPDPDRPYLQELGINPPRPGGG